MKWSLSRARLWVAVATLVALPWQTRWFQEGPLLGGYPWEQGRISIYVSWFLVFVGAVLRFAAMKQVSVERLEIEQRKSKGYVFRKNRVRRLLLLGGVMLLLLSSLHTLSVRATMQFWLEALSLIAFLWSVVDVLTINTFAKSVALSFFPWMLLGIQQFFTQHVMGTKWLGIASQDPLTPGVSVIEQGTARVLRVYGNFPHPNIFAAWLAIATLVSIFFLLSSPTRKQRIFWFVSVLISTIALILTFSRAALLATIVGFLILLGAAVVRKDIRSFPQREGRVMLTLILLTFVPIGWQTRHLWLIRTNPSVRLEQRSVNERTHGLQDGMKIFSESPILGVGPGAELVTIQRLHPQDQIPPIPPHLVPLIVLNELGVLGMMGIGFLGWGTGFWQRMKKSLPHPLARTLLGTALVLALFDHYFWTQWPGKTLLALIILGVVLVSKQDGSRLDAEASL